MTHAVAARKAGAAKFISNRFAESMELLFPQRNIGIIGVGENFFHARKDKMGRTGETVTQNTLATDRNHQNGQRVKDNDGPALTAIPFLLVLCLAISDCLPLHGG